MRQILLIVLSAAAIAAGAQSKKQKQLEQAFITYYCGCLSDIAKAEPEQILYNRTEVCIRKFFQDYTVLATEIINEDYNIDSLSGYERGRLLGSSIIQNGVDDLVKDCKFYRQTLSEYKHLMLDQVKAKKENVLLRIEELKDKESQMKSKKDLAVFYTIIGVLYEFADNRKMAFEYYDKSMNVFPTTSAKGLRKLLKME